MKVICTIAGVAYHSTNAGAKLAQTTGKRFREVAAKMGIEPDGQCRWWGPAEIDVWSYAKIKSVVLRIEYERHEREGLPLEYSILFSAGL